MDLNKGFSQEVCQKIGYYVYRLIDPRNGQTFYIGKGKGNRVFAHANDALKSWNGINFKENMEDDTSLKIQTIRDIKNSKLDVIHVIHRYGLEENEAFEVESALIDAYPGLTNLQNGRSNDRGVTNAQTLQDKYSLDIYSEIGNLKYIIIKVKWDRVLLMEDEQNLDRDDAIYEAVRYCWKINPEKAKNYDYVLGVIDGIVEGVYKVKEWKLADNGIRYEFEKDNNVDNSIVNNYIRKRIPEKYTKKGMANPVLYSN